MSLIDSGKKKIASLKEALKNTPDEAVKAGLSKYFQGYEKDALRILIVSIITCVCCYFYHIIYAYGCPDSLGEGFFFYRNADVATSSARWMVRYINFLVGRNVVIPVISFPLYCLIIGYSCYLLCKMFNIRGGVAQILLSATLISFPVVLHHFCYPYIANIYSFSFLMTVVGTKLIREKKVAGFIFGALAYLLMLGSYQSYIGAISALAFIALIWDMLNGEKVLKGLGNLLKVGAAGLLACVIDIPFSKFMANLAGVGLYDRASLSIESIFENLDFSFHFGYVWFFSYFYSDDFLSRKKMYTALSVIFVIMILIVLAKLVVKRKIGQAIVLLATTLLSPLAMNLCLIVFPSQGMRDIMRYHYVLVFVILFALLENESKAIYNNLIRYVAYICVIVLLAGNCIAANSTAFMHKIMYDYTRNQGEIMVSRLYELEGYEPNKTPVILSNAIDLSHLIYRYPMIFTYTESEGGPVFWGGYMGMGSCRYHFFFDFLGMDFKEFPEGDYLRITNSDEFKAMPVWPAEGSVAMIDGYAVIKNGEEPVR